MLPGHVYQRHMLQEDGEEEEEEELGMLLSGAGNLLSSYDHRETSSDPSSGSEHGDNMGFDDDEPYRERAIRHRGVNNHTAYNDSGEENSDDNLGAFPEWFMEGSFKHNHLIALPGILGLAVLLLLGGDL